MQTKITSSPQSPVAGVGSGKIPVGATEFVLSTYNPRVAVFSTSAATAIAAKNNLTVPQLIAPFTRVQTDASWHEPLTGQLIVPRGLRFTPVDLAIKKRLDMDSQRNKKFLQDTVGHYPPSLVETEDTKFHPRITKSGKGSAVGYNVDAPRNVPWFNAWREQFLKLHSETQSSQYDFLHHCMACILVMSSTDGQTGEELTETVAKLSKAQQQHQTTWSNNWAFPSVLKFYLILHETSQCDQDRANTMYQNLRTTYGGNFSFMVQISGVINDSNANETNDNSDIWSRYVDQEHDNNVNDDFHGETSQDDLDVVFHSDLIHPLSPDAEKIVSTSLANGKILPNNTLSIPLVRGQHLSPEDIDNIQNAMNEFVAKALLPYIDRQSRLLHESIVNRRGMSKSFFSATKRLFGGSAKTPSSIVYTNESLEMMSRKLADIYFLFGHYAGAYQLYHQLKKDFLGDSAWVYYASSLEMAAVSHFMMSQAEPPLAMARAFPVHYITDAITYYIDNCRMADSAIKCALISCECLKHMDSHSEAAAVYIRMTSEDCDLKSALMLEQAAHAFLNVNYIRKYALHCVLAGHRYSKAGLKMHSLKCYFQADQIYTGRGWRYAENHVHFTIVRHHSSLHLTSDISKYQKPLVTPPLQSTISTTTNNKITNNIKALPPPVLNCLKLEYSTLKLLNGTEFISLIRAQNLTPDGHVTISKLDYLNESLKINQVNSTPVTSNSIVLSNDSVIKLVPMESRNIVLKTQIKQLDHNMNNISLQIHWEFSKPGVATVYGQSKLAVEDLPRILSLHENSFIFELNHESRCENDFNVNPCFLYGVELFVHARVGGKFSFKMETNSSQSSIGPGVKTSGDELFFVGQTKWALDVVPLNTYTLKYTVAIMQPGVFNIAPAIIISSPTGLDEAPPPKYILHSPLIVTHRPS